MTFIDNTDSSASIAAMGGSLKESMKYQFTASTGLVSVMDMDCARIVSIFNQTRDESLYVRSSETLTGTVHQCSITVDVDTTSMADGDVLNIVYASKNTDTDLLLINNRLLSELIIEVRINNKILAESFAQPLYTEQDL